MPERRLTPFRLYTALAAVPTVLLAVVIARQLGWPGWLAYLLSINAVTACLFLYDKVAAGSDGSGRVPEATLHLAAFAGGTPAALAASQYLRHKTATAARRRAARRALERICLTRPGEVVA